MNPTSTAEVIPSYVQHTYSPFTEGVLLPPRLPACVCLLRGDSSTSTSMSCRAREGVACQGTWRCMCGVRLAVFQTRKPLTVMSLPFSADTAHLFQTLYKSLEPVHWCSRASAAVLYCMSSILLGSDLESSNWTSVTGCHPVS